MTQQLATEILALARASGRTITTAESCTGGMVSAAITDIAGSSDIFQRGYVTYSNAAKTEMLGVSPGTLAAYGAVSEEVVCQMARGARVAADAHIAVAISGIAGPGGSEHKPEGRVCFGLAIGTEVTSETQEFGAIGRAEVRQAATQRALELVRAALS
ncbi:CinA family protein [Allosediminivita pacifica]|uniref:Nicotinamide-nucleotide amidase n=1 Tax=Allosediminivita pacifica TaxID=1267769 RepID=A0A2T6B2L7_9RHOB|nr:CinA family protein [Allosediminivita pacifica]PTX50301.1 nicotinamide-nucleotide amidase [Allosediminivita pacifica]GGB03022.1 competence damage-inducible protein A [Allosediminivita pacifica]